MSSILYNIKIADSPLIEIISFLYHPKKHLPMQENLRYNPFSTKNAFFVALAVGFLQYLLIITTSFLNYQDRSAVSAGSILADILISYSGSVILLFILLKFSFWIAQKNIEPHRQHLYILSGLFLLTTPLSMLFSYLYDFLLHNPNMHLENTMYKKLVQDFVYAFIVFLLTVSISSIVKNQKIESENMRNRYEALKNQLDPHFLFNSLNTLDGLIGYDDETAHSYLQNLSLAFRNAIKNKEITELAEELAYKDAYMYLLKIRYGKNLQLKCNVDKKYSSWLLLHLTLQLLIENAVKHNTIDDKHPLSITIETTENNTIRIVNNKNPKLENEFIDRKGLSNMNERYLLVFGKGIKKEEDQQYFSIEIPMFEHYKENSPLIFS